MELELDDAARRAARGEAGFGLSFRLAEPMCVAVICDWAWVGAGTSTVEAAAGSPGIALQVRRTLMTFHVLVVACMPKPNSFSPCKVSTVDDGETEF